METRLRVCEVAEARRTGDGRGRLFFCMVFQRGGYQAEAGMWMFGKRGEARERGA